MFLLYLNFQQTLLCIYLAESRGKSVDVTADCQDGPKFRNSYDCFFSLIRVVWFLPGTTT